jgi:hypothetical protein
MKDQTIRPPVSAADAKRQEQRRVNAMIERDRQDRMREIERAAAEIEVNSGSIVSIRETVIEPTPEWFQHGDVEGFTPETPDRSAIVLKTVRRVQTPIIRRMMNAGKLDIDQYKALAWYADCYEHAGFHGNIPSVQIGKEVFGGGPDRVLFTEAQQDAQRQIRMLRAVITPHRMRFFEAVVIDNVPVARASRFIRTTRSNQLKLFKYEAQKVTVEAIRLGIIA